MIKYDLLTIVTCEAEESETMKAIYETKGKAREYCELAVNIYDGCTNGCTYCYAPDVTRTGRKKFYGTANVREGIIEAVKNQIASGAFADKLIHLCFTCDPYPTGCDTTATREIMKAIKDGGGHIQILTKNPSMLLAQDIDLLDAKDKVGTTISALNNEREPNSDPTTKRLAALMEIKQKCGCEAWISFEPVFDGDYVCRLIASLDWIDTFKVGKTNYVECDIDWKLFGQRVENVAKTFGRNVLIKKGLREEMEREDE